MKGQNSSLVSELSGSTGEHYHWSVHRWTHACIQILRTHLTDLKYLCMDLQESHEQCVQWIVRFIHSQHSPKRISFLYDCLGMAVETSLLPPRCVQIHI